jgi:hypothetical protein
MQLFGQNGQPCLGDDIIKQQSSRDNLRPCRLMSVVCLISQSTLYWQYVNTLQTAHKNSCVCVSGVADRSREFSFFSMFRLYTPYTVLTSHRHKFTAQLFSHMFTQVLGIMTLLVITSHSKQMPFVLPHSQAIFSH